MGAYFVACSATVEAQTMERLFPETPPAYKPFDQDAHPFV
jgi:hypothetical protein